jgi:hypothetical protein
MRCTEHPAFEADYCPTCGTARPVGMTTAEQLAAYPDADTVDAHGFDPTARSYASVTWTDVEDTADLVEWIRRTFDLAEFLTDPGGFLACHDVEASDMVAAAAINRIRREVEATAGVVSGPCACGATNPPLLPAHSYTRCDKVGGQA